MKSGLDKQHTIVLDTINETVLIGNSTRPHASEVATERFRFANSGMRIFQNRLDQI